ncbi:hypothetical protein FSP39_004986 [Pinctada imbricata]|uniref:PI3K-ABD domain-containing protein n=1 Tax=Pinctada imbricata TaxID=66713 RepID=A0AA89C8F0_PINIB|nr:hypothetical protein FSP39_004986 [Pinctada imbricata]
MPPVVVLPDLDISREVSPSDGHVDIDFLLPNGIFIPLRVDYFDTLENVKQHLWKEAEKYPLFPLLKKRDSYTFTYVNKQGEKDEIIEEDMTLNDFPMAARFLKLVPKQTDDRKFTLERQTNALIGMKCKYRFIYLDI